MSLMRWGASDCAAVSCRLAFVFVVASATTTLAQDFVAPLPDATEVITIDETDLRPSIDGIVKDIFTTRKPWQLINPAAPKEYGTGERLVSKDFGGGTPVKSAGVVVLGVEW